MRNRYQGPSRGFVFAIILTLAAIGGQGWPAGAEEPKADQVKPDQAQSELPKTEQPKVEKKHKVAKAPSACVGLTESACAGKTECFWRKAITTKTGKARKAHCRKKPQRTAKQSAT